MAKVVQEKSRGLKFAEQQLLRHGWEHGEGLGRAKNGISEAVKVKVKCDKGGVGHKEGEQFTFHWWDHVFNKASSSLQVESDQNGIKVKKMPEDDEEDGPISNKKPRKATLAKAKLYGYFVKSATLLSGQEQPQQKSSSRDESSSSSSSDEDDDHRLDLSSTTKLSDADLVKACGGRTAHKGARHGLTMSAKLARLEQQEAEFMAKYGRKSQPLSSSPVCCKPTPLTTMSAVEKAEQQEEPTEDTHQKKMLKKKKKKKSGQSVNELNGSEASESPKADVKPKKTKKKRANYPAEETADAVCTEDIICVENNEADCFYQTKMKRKKKKNKVEQNEEETYLTSPAAENSSLEETAELKPDTKMKKRKKGLTEEDPEFSQSELVQDQAPKTCHGAILVEETEVKEEQSTVKHKRTKCKRGKFFEDVKRNEEPFNLKKKKKKSKE